jgi:uridine phosphorylase
MSTLLASELIINNDGSVYHLAIKPEELATWIITVGDPDRVDLVSKYFDSIDIIRQHREFVIHTGKLNGKRITVMSTGMGTDNIDIVMNELDALVNIDFETRMVKKHLTSLKIIRLGTSGSLQASLPIDSLLVSEIAVGYDGLLGFYHLEDAHNEPEWNEILPTLGYIKPGMYKASSYLLEHLGAGITRGVTYTAAGFYAPQGRKLRIENAHDHLVETLTNLQLPGGRKFSNMEMETSGLYGLGTVLGHEVISFSTLLANRITGQFSTQGEQSVDHLIRTIIDKIALIITD